MATHSLYLPLLFDEQIMAYQQVKDYLPDTTMRAVITQAFYWWPAIERGEFIEERLLRHLDSFTRHGANLSPEHSLTAAFHVSQLMVAIYELYAPLVNPTLQQLGSSTYQIECHIDSAGDPRIIIHI